MALAIQRTAGNAALTQLLQPRESATTSPHPALPYDTPVVQRYQAGEPGHGGIEADALHQAGFGGTMTEGEIGKTYFGNWMRDFSQVGNAHDPMMLLVLNVLAMGEFNRQLTAEDIGGYVPSEHLDRPTAGVTKADVGEAALPAMDKKDEAKLSDAQRLWIKEEQDPSFKEMIRQRAAASHLPTYIEVGKEHSKRMLHFAATHKRGDPAVMAAIGNGLHAVEDYFSHSDFVDAAIYMLVRDHELPASSPLYKGIVGRRKQLDYDPSGGLAHGARRAQIYSGSVRPEGNAMVSKLEILESEIRSGALHKAAILGALRLGWVKGGEYGEKGLGAVGKVAGGVIGAPIGLVAGAGAGAGRGAAKGWHEGHGIKKLWTGTKGFFGGLFHGGKSGTVEGWQTGGELGKKGLGAVGRVAGELITPAIAAAAVAAVLAVVDGLIVAAKAAQKGIQAGAAAVQGTVSGVAGAAKGIAKGWSQGHGLGKVTGAMKEGASGGARGAGSGAAKGWHSASDEAIEVHYINKATKTDRVAKDPLPNHSQLAKDDTGHPLYGVSRSLAIVADREIGRAMIAAWEKPGNKAAVEAVENLVDTFVCHPADNPWWKQPLKDVATGNPLKAEYTLPALAAQPAPTRSKAPERELVGQN
ncbi:MAG TPA: HET-C-related protein [Candidatus Dormibacteraeota bacterium]|nr:HET-C-related protein [Candidatus Dormibacteraeota bacterium]